MLNRKVFTLGTALRPMGKAPLTGGSAARFAGAILARHAVCDEGGSYQEAWLVLREEERQEQLQATSEVQLTQLTLRLLLQLSAYFTQTQPPQMELQSLQRSLSHCMTALESRESYSVIRLLAERLDTVKTETENRQLQESIARQLETITLRETPLPARPQSAAASPIDKSGKRAGERPGEPRRLEDAQAERLALPHSMRFLRENSGRQAEPHPRFFAKEQTGAFLSSIQTPFPFSAGIAPLFNHLPLRANGEGSPQSTVLSGHAAAEQKRFDTLAEHKERLLRLLLNTDTLERETIWTLISNQTRLIDRHRDFLREESHLATEERLTHVIQQSTAQEYTKLLFVIEQALQEKKPPIEQPLPPTALPPSPTVKAVEPGVVPLSTLEKTRGKARKTALLQLLKNSPAAVRKGFFALADDSGIWEQGPTGESVRAQQQRLTQLLQASSTSQLETLTQWLRQRVSVEETAENGAPTAKNTKQKMPAGKPNENGETRQSAPAPRDVRAEETAALTALQHFLKESRQAERQGLLQLAEAAPEEERTALLAGLAQLLPPQMPQAQGDWNPNEQLVYLLEKHGDLPTLAEQLRTTQPILAWERTRGEEQKILTRLAAYAESRGNSWAKQKEQLLDGLQESERQILLTRLERIAPPPVKETAVPLAATQELERILKFQTQREYKSFRYQITRYLREQTPPPPPLTESGAHWLAEHRQAERQGAAQALTALTAQRPAAWRQVLEGLAIFPAVGEEQALRESLTQAVETSAAPVYEHLVQALTHRKELPRGFMAQMMPALRQTLPPLPSTERIASTPRTTLQELTRISPSQISSSWMVPLHSVLSNPLRFAAANGVFSAASALPALQEPGQSVRTKDAGAQGMGTKNITTQSFQQNLIARLFPTRETVREIVGAAARETASPLERWRQGNTAGRWEQPETSRALGDTAARRAALPLLKNHAAPWQAARSDHREKDTNRPAAQPPAQGKLPTFPAVERAQLPRPHYPESEAEMALRRTQTGEGVRRVADQVAARTAELTIQRQTPDLHLLRTQTKEQAQTIEQQRKSLSEIQSQLERQEKLVQQALHKTDDPPAEVRKLTKAVLREMEGQLQLERQRRGV